MSRALGKKRKERNQAADPTGLGVALEALGFRRHRHRQRSAWKRRGLIAVPGRSWCTFQSPCRGDVEPLGELGSPGLWKRVRHCGATGAERAIREFHVPLDVLNLNSGPYAARRARGARLGGFVGDIDRDIDRDVELDDRDEGLDRLAACVEWAEQTANGRVEAWAAPQREEVLSWLGSEPLTVVAEGFVHEIAIVRAPHRLALRSTLLERVQPEISAARRAWLREVLVDGQDRWFLARVGAAHESAGAAAVGVEVDLSGAPAWGLEPLSAAAVAALRRLVSWLVRPVRFLNDPGVTCGAWEMVPERARPAERR